MGVRQIKRGGRGTGAEEEELIRSNTLGVCDTLNCQRSKENTSVKIFYNQALAQFNLPRSRLRGSGMIGDSDKGMKVKGGKMIKGKKSLALIQTITAV